MKFGEMMSSCRTLPLNRSGERRIHGTFDAASARDVSTALVGCDRGAALRERSGGHYAESVSSH